MSAIGGRVQPVDATLLSHSFCWGLNPKVLSQYRKMTQSGHQRQFAIRSNLIFVPVRSLLPR